MISTLLLDLDQTLLTNPNESFVPAFFQLLAASLARLLPGEEVVTALQAAVAAMLANDDVTRTLRETFIEAFVSQTGVDSQALATQVEEFYRAEYPTLGPLTQSKPEARELLAWANAAGLKVCIATNPLYPLKGVEQRLAWAGIGVDEFDYTLIATNELMHYCKPKPKYYAELLALIGQRPQEAIMVGDDWERDIVPASAAGLHTYWINASTERLPEARHAPNGRGSLADFIKWARDDDCLNLLPVTPLEPPALLAGLAGNLAAFHTGAMGVADWKRKPAPGEWSLTEILAHLRDAEIEVNLARLHRLATETEPFVSAADTDPWAIERNYQAQDGPAALREFTEARRATLAFLHSASPDFWARSARHSILGRTTPAELVSFSLEHDLIHLTQIRSLNRP